MNGVERIRAAFARARQESRAALMPYFTAGFPDRKTSAAVFEAIARSGADLIELGVPFSDPLADGPTIQRSSQIALAQGTRPADCFALARSLRQEKGVTVPLLLMGYINPILAYGPQRYVQDAALAGVDGLIIPDLPVDEGEEMEAACRAAGLALVYLLAPTSTAERIALVAGHSSGFIYLVSVTGVTGARQETPVGLAEFVARVRAVSDLPLAVGFGIATPERAAQIGQLADGVIVGSAMITHADSTADPALSVGKFVAALRAALGKVSVGVEGKN